MKRPLKILLVQTANSNLGDNVIADNHEYLIKKICGTDAVVFNYSIASRDVEQIRFVDAVIFAGGILKVTNELFHIYIPEIINKAQEYNVPVYLSSIGVEKFYADNADSLSVKESLNLPCVKGIAVRDDIETLKRDYIYNPDIKILPVWDVAVWSKDTYRSALSNITNSPDVSETTNGIHSSDSRNSSNTRIGVGIVRHKLFEDYGHPEITYDIQMNYWTGVIRELESRGFNWAIFTNGDAYDEEMAYDVLSAVGHGEKLPAPLDGAALVKMISGFSGVIAGRMHSNIIAFSLGIPSIGFVWNQKLRFWGEKIGYPERFLECSELNAEVSVNRLAEALEKSCGPTDEMKNAVFNGLKDFIEHYAVPSEKKPTEVKYNFEKVLGANHLGSIRTRYPRTNSEEAFTASLRAGYEILQVDLRLTSDGSLVCVDRWHKDTYKLFGIKPEELEYPDKGLDFETFKAKKYNNRYTPLTFDQFFSLLKEAPKKFELIIGVGKPSKENLEKIISIIKASEHKRFFRHHNIIFRGERKSDIETMKKAFPHLTYMYFLVAGKDILEDEILKKQKFNEMVSWCQSQKVKYISVSSNIYSPDMIHQAHNFGIKFCLNSNDKTEQIIEAERAGADIILNQTYLLSYLKQLTE